VLRKFGYKIKEGNKEINIELNKWKQLTGGGKQLQHQHPHDPRVGNPSGSATLTRT
jgi:hypothetical protein